MLVWGLLPLGIAAVLGVLRLRDRARRRRAKVDPDFVDRDPAEQRVDQKAYRRAREVRWFNDPGW
ncbi:hypothetical protein GCM10010531_35690 [Blastococcus jejuensis]|uniref:PEP-CTERM protein-sorting domain-containing protein n=1 Tax=Blastococcus jejuensis TaxID=351224 RepID=A0ABP6PH93_9ACTN